MGSAQQPVGASSAAALRRLLAQRSALMGPQAPLFYQQPLVITRGRGVWLHDDAGRRYLDAYNNVPHVGHCHPVVVKAVQRQLARLNLHSRYLSTEVLAYHERLLDKFPKALGSVVLTCTGSEANDLALRIARLCTGHEGVIVTDWTYHGNSAAVAEISSAYSSLPPSPRVRCVPAPQAADGGAAFLQALRQAIAHFAELGIGLAALLIEPIFSTDGLHPVPKGCIKAAVALVRQAGGLYIADEVQSGFGRLGRHWWGFQSHGVLPDLVTLGKSMGNGYPLAGVVGRRALIAQFREQVMYFNTFGAGHAACAAGRAVLEVIEGEDLMARATEVGAALAAGLQALRQQHACLGEVRGQGFFLGLEILREDASGTSGAPGTPDSERAAQVVERMKQAGVLVSKIGRHDNVLKIRPPMPFDHSHARRLLRALDGALKPALPR